MPPTTTLLSPPRPSPREDFLDRSISGDKILRCLLYLVLGDAPSLRRSPRVPRSIDGPRVFGETPTPTLPSPQPPSSVHFHSRVPWRYSGGCGLLSQGTPDESGYRRGSVIGVETQLQDIWCPLYPPGPRIS